MEKAGSDAQKCFIRIVSAPWNSSLASELCFSGSAALAFTVFPDEPDADKSLTSLAAHSPPVIVAVGLSSAMLLDRTVGKLGLGELQSYATLGVGDTECCSVERLGVDDDAAFDRVPYGLFG